MDRRRSQLAEKWKIGKYLFKFQLAKRQNGAPLPESRGKRSDQLIGQRAESSCKPQKLFTVDKHSLQPDSTRTAYTGHNVHRASKQAQVGVLLLLITLLVFWTVRNV